MFLRKPRLFQSVVFRLTLWYGTIFSLSMLAAFLAFYFAMATLLNHRWNEDALDDIEEYSHLLATKGRSALTNVLRQDAESDGVENVFYRILSLEGKTIFSSDMTPWEAIGVNPVALEQLRKGKKFFSEILTLPGHKYKVHVAYGLLSPNDILQTGESTEEDSTVLHLMREIFVPIMISVVLSAIFIAWGIAKRAMAGVERVTETAFRISQGDLGKRVIVPDEKGEIAKLAMTFNVMLDKIDTLIREVKEMGDGLAHDLRTPLARIRGEAEACLTRRDMTSQEYKKMAASTVEECDRLLNIINIMMDISEAEAGALRLQREEVDIVLIVNEACELFQVVAEDNGLTIDKELPDSCKLFADKRKIQRVISNLLDNSMKFTPEGGVVRVSIGSDQHSVSIKVEDTGPGISREDLPHIFERFYRSDKSRSLPGSGLGLSLVRAIVRAHGGRINVESTPGQGTVITIQLPKGPSA